MKKVKLTSKQKQSILSACQREADLYKDFQKAQDALTNATREKDDVIALVADSHSIDLEKFEPQYTITDAGEWQLKEKSFAEQMKVAAKAAGKNKKM